MGLDDKYQIEVRTDIFREIGQRGNGKNKNVVGMGVSDNTLVRDKSLYTRLLGNYKQMISQLQVDPAQKMEEENLEQLFQEEPMELEIEPEPSESIHVNSHKRKMMENEMDREMKRNKRDDNPQYPAVLQSWHAYWTEKLKKGFLNDVPKEFTRYEKPPTIEQFAETKSGDAMLKFSKFIANQFQ